MSNNANPGPSRPDLPDAGLPEALLTVAVDGGTTNSRARLLRGTTLVSEARRAVGARDVATSGDSLPLATAIREAIAEVCWAAGVDRPDQIVASGMMTSEVGLAAVPHVAAPASLDDLARHAVVLDRPDVAPAPILLVPGIRTPAADGPDGWARADVMRGEECEVIGLCAALCSKGQIHVRHPERLIFVLPGSHTKLLAVDWAGGAARIVSSHTTLAGEMLAALASHTILAASLPDELPAELDQDLVESGARLARREGLGRTAFLVRIAALTQGWSKVQLASFLIGAVVAEDVARLEAHALFDVDEKPGLLVVGGSEPRRGAYARMLGRATVTADHNYATALGATLVGLRRLGSP